LYLLSQQRIYHANVVSSLREKYGKESATVPELANDFQQTGTALPVNWIVTRRPAEAGLDCPFQSATVEVCRMDTAK
jgi:hypothetical protein